RHAAVFGGAHAASVFFHRIEDARPVVLAPAREERVVARDVDGAAQAVGFDEGSGMGARIRFPGSRGRILGIEQVRTGEWARRGFGRSLHLFLLLMPSRDRLSWPFREVFPLSAAAYRR